MSSSQWIYELDPSWTLFLDRDGVLNRKIDGDYIRNPSMLEILPGVLESLFLLKEYFNIIVVATNQQGIAKELMTHDDLYSVHEALLNEVHNANGRIDQVYYSPDWAGLESSTRKPAIGMALQAQKDFPQIDFDKSIMVGDSQSDIDFAASAGMKSVWIDLGRVKCSGYDLRVSSLREFAKMIVKK